MARVLHIVDRVSGGVPVAARTYIRHGADDVEHVVLTPSEGADAPWGAVAVLDLPDGHGRRVRAVRDAVRRVGPDVVHAHSSFSGVYARLALGRRGRRGRPRVVYSPHCFAFERTDVARPVARAYRMIESALGRRTDVLAACGPGELRIAEGFASLRGRAALVPNVATVPERAVRPWQGGTLRVAMSGRVSTQKGPEAFVALIHQLRGAGVDTAPVWIGSGDADTTRTLEGAGVEVTGWLDHESTADALAAADVYVHTAAWEGFPLAVLDAHACALPILVRPIAAFAGLPPSLTTDVLPAMIDASVSPERFALWAEANRAGWRGYLEGNTVEHQRAALARVWGTA